MLQLRGHLLGCLLCHYLNMGLSCVAVFHDAIALRYAVPLLTVHAVLSSQLTMLFLVQRVACPLCNLMKSETSLQAY